MSVEYREIISFWFDQLKPEQWWKVDHKLDQEITEKFLSIHQSATQGELWTWRDTPMGRLAEIIILDQFSRNIYRNSGKSFQWDSMALVLAQEAIRVGADQELSAAKKAFVYLPFMHSESKVIHEQAVQLYSEPGLEYNLEFEYKHKEIIDRFGRYPHRNDSLGRTSTQEETEFLKSFSSF